MQADLVAHHLSRRVMWQRWTGASMGGAAVAVLLYAMLPYAITYPGMGYDQYDYVAAPWRFLVTYGVVYSALSAAQWLVLRRYVADAWQWVVVTVASVAVLFPGTIWLFNRFGPKDIAELIWSAGMVVFEYPFGFGGHLFAILGQAFILERWTRSAWLWLVLAPFLGGCALVVALILAAPLERLMGTGISVTAFNFLAWTIYYALSGFVMATLLTEDRRVEDLPR